MLPCRWTPSQYNGLVGSLGRLLRASSGIHCQLEDPHNPFSFWLFARMAHRTHWHTNCFDLLELKDGLKKGKFSIWMFQVSFLSACGPYLSLIVDVYSTDSLLSDDEAHLNFPTDYCIWSITHMTWSPDPIKIRSTIWCHLALFTGSQQSKHPDQLCYSKNFEFISQN